MPIYSKGRASLHGTTEARTDTDTDMTYSAEAGGLMDYLLPHIRAFYGDGVPI